MKIVSVCIDKSKPFDYRFGKGAFNKKLSITWDEGKCNSVCNPGPCYIDIQVWKARLILFYLTVT